MMKILTLEELRREIRLEPDDVHEDLWLEDKGAAAEVAVARLCQCDVTDLQAEYGPGLEDAPDLRSAMAGLVTHWYKYRELTTPDATNRVPMSLADIVMPYVKLV